MIKINKKTEIEREREVRGKEKEREGVLERGKNRKENKKRYIR